MLKPEITILEEKMDMFTWHKEKVLKKRRRRGKMKGEKNFSRGLNPSSLECRPHPTNTHVRAMQFNDPPIMYTKHKERQES